MTLVARLVGYQVRDVTRSRWLLLYLLFYLLLTDALFRFGGSSARVVLSLTNVVLALVPLVSLIFSTMYLYHAREFIEMMLAQPVSRRTLFTSLYLGLALPVAGSFLVGIGLPFAWHGEVGTRLLPVVVLLATSASLSLVFTGLAFVIALRWQDRAAGLGTAILVWLGATVLYDGALLLGVALLDAYPLERPLLAASFLNPVDLGRVLLLLQFDAGALAGYTGAVFERFFRTVEGSLLSATSLILWMVLPCGLALRLFERRDF